MEWAAQNGNVRTLHYSLITALKLPGDSIGVVNPYGYTEVLMVRDFLARTSFRACTDIPPAYQFGSAFGLFEKNTIFLSESQRLDKTPLSSK